MADTGLLMSMLEDGSQVDIIDGNLGIYKGAIYENIIADIFAKSGKKLYYYQKDNRLEIDFFIRYEKAATAVEVKSGRNTKGQSVNIIGRYGVKKAIKLTVNNIHDTGAILHLPLYMACFL
jgi:predicted AAA+ superfamily ATPase